MAICQKNLPSYEVLAVLNYETDFGVFISQPTNARPFLVEIMRFIDLSDRLDYLVVFCCGFQYGLSCPLLGDLGDFFA